MSALSIIDRKEYFKAYTKAETKFDESRKEAKVANIILDELDPEASKSQKAQAKKDHEAKKALVKDQLAKNSESAGGCSHSMRISLATTLKQIGTKL